MCRGRNASGSSFFLPVMSMITPISVTTPPTISAASQGSTTFDNPYTAESSRNSTPKNVTAPPDATLTMPVLTSPIAWVVSALASASSFANSVVTSSARRRRRLGTVSESRDANGPSRSGVRPSPVSL